MIVRPSLAVTLCVLAVSALLATGCGDSKPWSARSTASWARRRWSAD